VNPIPTSAPRAAAGRGAYFFLSYAHSAPSGDMQTDTDHWVRVFYKDLAEAVQRYAQPAAGLTTGFIDDLVQPGSDWNAMLSDALGAAEVFVALYSPGYFNKSWPRRVRESFRYRLRELEGVADRQRHVLPVLWVPLLSWEMTPEIQEALPLGDGIPVYAENGLRALCMLPSYREGAYRVIVDKIARQVVDVAENFPVGPSWAPPPEELPDGSDAEKQFTVAVIAPTVQSRPAGRDPLTYGADQTQWRPFADEQALPLAQYVANTAERLGLPAHTVAFTEDPQAVRERAAVLLIDLWAAAGARGPSRVRSILATLPEWVMPLVVVDHDDPQYESQGVALARTFGDMLAGSGPLQVIEAQDMRQFLDSVPVLVTEARRRYLKFGPKPGPVDGPPGIMSPQPRK
jgi:FxsC-like protein